MSDSSKKVTRERWVDAQQWEEHHWVNAQRIRARYGKNLIWRVLSFLRLVPRYRGNDWNDWWRNQFQGYSFLPAEMDNAIELGCGPYTNIRLMMKHCRIAHLFLSDPLMRTYVNFKLTLLSEVPRGQFAILDDHPLEQMPFAKNYFDLVVMINVLDHVQDADLCMQNAIELTKIGGIFIFGQDLTNEQDRERLKKDPGEVGHPIKLTHDWVDTHLGDRFEPIIQKVLSREEGRGPEAHYGTYVFAAQRKR